MLTDWEKDTWKQVYYNLSKKTAFHYTFDRKEAQEKIFPFSLGEVPSTTLKAP